MTQIMFIVVVQQAMKKVEVCAQLRWIEALNSLLVRLFPAGTSFVVSEYQIQSLALVKMPSKAAHR